MDDREIASILEEVIAGDETAAPAPAEPKAKLAALSSAPQSGGSKTIAIAFPIRIGTHYAHFLQTFERYAGAYGYHLIASTIGHSNLDNVRPDLLDLIDGPFSAIVIVDLPTAFRQYIDDLLSEARKPIVSVGMYTAPGIDCVEVRFDQGVHEALGHLLASNAKRIAFFGPGIRDEGSVLDTFAENSNLDPRVTGFINAMHAGGRRLELIRGNPGSRRESMRALQEHISEYGCPNAMFCFNDEMAIAALRALLDAGIRVPEDILLVGCDGVEEGEYVNPRLSTIVQPITQMCASTWELLTNRIANRQSPPQCVVVEAKFVERASSASPCRDA